MHAHEEQPGLGVAELVGVDDVAAALKQEAGDAVDDARAVGAGEGEDVVGQQAGVPEVAVVTRNSKKALLAQPDDALAQL